ncbi:MAG: hypothetical protein ACXVPC_09605 [Tumebacillaceae bacterium]
MLLGDQYVYQIRWLDDGYWLLMLGAPVLFFIGYQLMEANARRKQATIPIVVQPLDHDWEAYTTNQKVIADITNAVVQMRSRVNYDRSKPITYSMFRAFLRLPEADTVARKIPEYGVYRRETT